MDSSTQSASLDEFEKKVAILSKEKEEHEQLFNQLREREEDLKRRIAETERTIELVRDEMNQVTRKLDSRQNEYNLTKSLVDNLEGFPEAIKFLKKQSSWGKNAPLLSDIIACSEEYRISIENFLEPVMNYYYLMLHEERPISLCSNTSKS
jgi:chromosome segregation protein